MLGNKTEPAKVASAFDVFCEELPNKSLEIGDVVTDGLEVDSHTAHHQDTNTHKRSHRNPSFQHGFGVRMLENGSFNQVLSFIEKRMQNLEKRLHLLGAHIKVARIKHVTAYQRELDHP